MVSDVEFSVNPFSSIKIPDGFNLREHKDTNNANTEKVQEKRDLPKRTLYVRIAKKGRAGKSVTLISGFSNSNQDLLESTCRKLRKEMGTGGTFYEDTMELQGDQRLKAAQWFKEKGFKVKGEIQ